MHFKASRNLLQFLIKPSISAFCLILKLKDLWRKRISNLDWLFLQKEKLPLYGQLFYLVNVQLKFLYFKYIVFIFYQGINAAFVKPEGRWSDAQLVTFGGKPAGADFLSLTVEGEYIELVASFFAGEAKQQQVVVGIDDEFRKSG